MQQYHSSFSIDGQLVKTLSKYYMLCKTNLKRCIKLVTYTTIDIKTRHTKSKSIRALPRNIFVYCCRKVSQVGLGFLIFSVDVFVMKLN